MSGEAHGTEWDAMLNGFVDDELDAANALRCEQHIATCAACAETVERILATRHRLRQPGVSFAVPHGLRERVIAAIDEAGDVPSLASRARQLFARLRASLGTAGVWSLAPSLAVLATALVLLVAPPRPDRTTEDDLLAGHVRSLLADHLTDVQTSNQHVVKPWFNGRIDFSPPVVDLASRGFPLVGGRVDYVGGRVVAALVYRRNGHIINLFVWPGAGAPSSADAREGYNLIEWSRDGLRFSAVSDLNASELQSFQREFEQAG